jgi:hypothetical protein
MPEEVWAVATTTAGPSTSLSSAQDDDILESAIESKSNDNGKKHGKTRFHYPR